MLQTPERVSTITMCCCVMHNLLRTRYGSDTNVTADREDPETHEVIPGSWRDTATLVGLQSVAGNTSSKAGKAQRDYRCMYVNSPAGQVPWQDRMI